MAKKKEFGTVVDDTIQQAEDIREVQRSADRVGEEQQPAQQEQQSVTAPETNTSEPDDTAVTAAPVSDGSASGNSTKSKGKRTGTKTTKLTSGQDITTLVITDKFKKHTMTVYEPLYELLTTMSKAWNVNIQDAVALVMLSGVRAFKNKIRPDVKTLLNEFASDKTEAEIEKMKADFLREQTNTLLANAGLTLADLQRLTEAQKKK